MFMMAATCWRSFELAREWQSVRKVTFFVFGIIELCFNFDVFLNGCNGIRLKIVGF